MNLLNFPCPDAAEGHYFHRINYVSNLHTCIQSINPKLGMAPPGGRRLRRAVGAAGTSGPSTRGSLTGGASKPYRAGAGLLSEGFFRRGLGREPLERTPLISVRSNVSCPSPPPRAVRGSAFYTEPQDPPSPGILLEIARALWAGPWAILAQLGDATPYPVGGVPPSGSWVALLSLGRWA